MSRSYVPNDDIGFHIWAEALASNIAGEPEKYRFSQAEAAELAASVRTFGAALATATCEITRTRPAIREKDDARKTCEAMCRRFAMSIKHNPSISDADKINAGVRPKERLSPRTRRR